MSFFRFNVLALVENDGDFPCAILFAGRRNNKEVVLVNILMPSFYLLHYNAVALLIIINRVKAYFLNVLLWL